MPKADDAVAPGHLPDRVGGATWPKPAGAQFHKHLFDEADKPMATIVH